MNNFSLISQFEVVEASTFTKPNNIRWVDHTLKLASLDVIVRRNILLWDVLENTSKIIHSGTDSIGSVILSSDATHVAFGLNSSLYIKNIETNETTQNFTWMNRVLHPLDWSIDETTILFKFGDFENRTDTYLLLDVATNQIKQNITLSQNNFLESWTPDLRKLLFEDRTQGKTWSYKIWNSETGAITEISADFTGDISSISPDGDKLFTGFRDLFQISEITNQLPIVTYKIFEFNRNLGILAMIIGTGTVIISLLVKWRLK